MRARLACALAWAFGIGAAASLPARADEPKVQAALGTVHEALFGIALDGTSGIAVGAGGDLRESGDGGASWKALAAAPTRLALLGVALHGTHAIAVGQQGAIVVRDANGAWKLIDSGSKSRLLGVGVNSGGLAFAVGAFGALLKSSDGGQSWQALTLNWADYVEGGAEPHLYAVDVADDGVVTIVGEFGLILRSEDSGTSWTRKNQGEASLFALDLRPDGLGYAVGQDGLALKTSDHGRSWSAIDVGSKANLLGVAALADGRLYATGMHEVFVGRDGERWQRLQAKELPPLWYAAIAAAGGGATDVIAVGQAGAVVRIGR